MLNVYLPREQKIIEQKSVKQKLNWIQAILKLNAVQITITKKRGVSTLLIGLEEK